VAKKRNHNRIHEMIQAEAPYEHDLFDWLEHVAHWHALLFAVLVVLTVGYTLFNRLST
jgi:hypothetical protein